MILGASAWLSAGMRLRRRARILTFLAAIGILAAALFTSGSARADGDGELWLWTELRLPVIASDKPRFPRFDWRIVTDFRLNNRSKGLAQAFFRTGPILYATDFLFIALHGTVYSDRLATGRHETEARVELEPNFFGRLGDFTFNDRNRLESRWRTDDQRFRYRNQLRVNYAPIGAKWIPFVWDEVLVDLAGLGLNQNRLEFGLGRLLSDTTRLDVGYMIRSREAAGTWTHDHVLNLYLFIDVPKPVAKPKPSTDGPQSGEGR